MYKIQYNNNKKRYSLRRKHNQKYLKNKINSARSGLVSPTKMAFQPVGFLQCFSNQLTNHKKKEKKSQKRGRRGGDWRVNADRGWKKKKKKSQEQKRVTMVIKMRIQFYTNLKISIQKSTHKITVPLQSRIYVYTYCKRYKKIKKYRRYFIFFSVWR